MAERSMNKQFCGRYKTKNFNESPNTQSCTILGSIRILVLRKKLSTVSKTDNPMSTVSCGG